MENAIIEDEDFLSSVMNTMEKIENTSDEAVIKEIREVNSKEIERLMKVLSKSFKEGDLEAAFDATLRLQYLMRIQDISESKIGIS
jgi:predicted patatin/cPLA2 family phospholipase